MPEGDTVFRTARRLDAALAGRTLSRTQFRVPALATADLSGVQVPRTWTHGKHLFTELRPPSGGAVRTLHTHLKMEGTWLTYRLGQPWTRPGSTARVVLESDDRQAVGFSLGVVELLDESQVDDLVRGLGPDLLSERFDADEAQRRLLAHAALPFVQAVQDQSLMAGLGNMYACELAFLVGTHPATPLSRAPDVGRVVTLARRLLAQNVTRAVQSTTGVLTRGRTTWVYRQQACRRCHSTVRVGPVGPVGAERTTYWCPRCQPG